MTNESRRLAPDAEYWNRRESQERLAAETTNDPTARRIHTELAESYAERVRATMPALG